MIVSPVAQLQLVDQEPNCRNVLHLITHDGFEEFGHELFSWVEQSVEQSVGLSFTLAVQLLLLDKEGLMPLTYALETSNQQLCEPGSFVMDLLVKSFEAWCFATSGELMHSAIADIPCAGELQQLLRDKLDEIGQKNDVEQTLREAILQAVDEKLKMSTNPGNRASLKAGSKKVGKEAEEAMKLMWGSHWLGCKETVSQPSAQKTIPTGVSKQGTHVVQVDDSAVLRLNRRPLLHMAAEHCSPKAVQLLLDMRYPLNAQDQPPRGEEHYALEFAASSRYPHKVFRMIARATVDALHELWVHHNDGDTERRRALSRTLRRGWYELVKRINPNIGRSGLLTREVSRARGAKKVVKEVFQDKDATDGKGLLHDFCRCQEQFLREHEQDELLPVLLYCQDGCSPVVVQQRDTSNHTPFEYELQRGMCGGPAFRRPVPRMRVCKYLIVNYIHTGEERQALNYWRTVSMLHATGNLTQEFHPDPHDKEKVPHIEELLSWMGLDDNQHTEEIDCENHAEISHQALKFALSILTHTSYTQEQDTLLFHAASYGCTDLISEITQLLSKLVGRSQDTQRKSHPAHKTKGNRLTGKMESCSAKLPLPRCIMWLGSNWVMKR